MNFPRIGREVLSIEIEGLRHARQHIGNDFAKAVRHILRVLSTGSKIVVTGVGKNLHIAQKISSTLASTGSTSVVLNATQAMHGDIGILRNGDVLLALSYSGESDELTSLLPIVRRSGVSVIAITGSPMSSLARFSDVVIRVPVRREACPFNLAPTASTTAALAVGDAMAIALLRARGLKKEDYARLHPAGAIGRTLLMRVSDIMRTGRRLVRIRKSTPVRDVLLAMTGARTGVSAIVDRHNKLLGIFTDGDLRRNLAKHRDLMDMPVEKVMTRSPVTIRADQLAADALKVYEERNIDDLAVVDEKGRLVGTVDIQDLPKFKII